MSLINDALKRARETQKPAPADAPAAPPLRPVESAPPSTPHSSVMVPALGTAVVLIALFFAWQWLAHHSLVKAAAAQDPSHLAGNPAQAANPTDSGSLGVARSTASPSTAGPGGPGLPTEPSGVSQSSGSSPAVTPPAPTPSAATPGPNASALGATAPQPTGTQVAAAATPTTDSNAPAPTTDGNHAVGASQTPPKPAPLKLQSIVYNPTRPSAMINGRVLFVGEKIGGFRVTAITEDSATLVGTGQTNVLNLAQ
jgi:hypothetical protein